MVDFKKLREAKAKPKPLNPRDIFNALPKPPGINDLYASQAEVLDAWYGRSTASTRSPGRAERRAGRRGFSHCSRRCAVARSPAQGTGRAATPYARLGCPSARGRA
jgi:hypothetical protein